MSLQTTPDHQLFMTLISHDGRSRLLTQSDEHVSSCGTVAGTDIKKRSQASTPPPSPLPTPLQSVCTIYETTGPMPASMARIVKR